MPQRFSEVLKQGCNMLIPEVDCQKSPCTLATTWKHNDFTSGICDETYLLRYDKKFNNSKLF